MKRRYLALAIAALALSVAFGPQLIQAGGWVHGVANGRVGPAGATGAAGAGFVFTYGTYTATGTVQGTCTSITTNVANVTSGDTKAVCLPASGGISVGDIYDVICSTSASPGGYNAGSFQHYCLIFPNSGDTITPFSANASDTIPAGMMARYRFKGSSTWQAEHGSLETSDGNSTYGLVYAYGDITMGGGGSATARLIMQGNSGNQINMSGAGENKISFPSNTGAGAFYIWTLSSGQHYIDMISTNNANQMFYSVPLFGVTGPKVAVAGTGQSTATVVPASSVVAQMTGCDGTKGARLPTGNLTRGVRLVAQDSTSANTCKVYPAVGGTINAGSANAAYVHPAGMSLMYVCDGSSNCETQ